MDNVHCVGNEPELTSCMFNPWGENDCSHTEDIIIECSEDGGSSTPPTPTPTPTPTPNGDEGSYFLFLV